MSIFLKGMIDDIFTSFSLSTRSRYQNLFSYWETRYAQGGNSGDGSYGKLAEFKSRILNFFVHSNNVSSVIEFGCGDGNQLITTNYPHYIGLDIAPSAIKICQRLFEDDKNKEFYLYEPDFFNTGSDKYQADLGLSLDVIYHLVDDGVFQQYMLHLFDSAKRFVVIYSSNFDDFSASHLRHRKFTDWISENTKGWDLIEYIPNQYPDKSSAHFFIYKHTY